METLQKISTFVKKNYIINIVVYRKLEEAPMKASRKAWVMSKMAYMKKVSFFRRLKTRVCHLWHLGTTRAQP